MGPFLRHSVVSVLVSVQCTQFADCEVGIAGLLSLSDSAYLS